jgi:hypothetical protein
MCAKLSDPAFEKHVRESLASWDGADPKLIDRTVQWVLSLRNEIVNLLCELEDSEDVGMTLAITYIELKSRWIALNTKVNYQTFRLGKCDPEVAFRGAACSALLGLCEGLIEPSDIEQITEFLARPINRAA